MDSREIKPEKITTPIQLLGAWLAGLLSVDACFLFAASNMDQGSWESGLLVVAAIVNVPMFIVAVFLLQTKFRPELQEDSYYSTYLNRKTNEFVTVAKKEHDLQGIQVKLERIEKIIEASLPTTTRNVDLSRLGIGVNVNLKIADDVKKKLMEMGVNYCTGFGLNIDPPEVLKVSYSQSLSQTEIDEILKLAAELGFEYYDSYREEEEGELIEQVLFGSYGEEDIRSLRGPT